MVDVIRRKIKYLCTPVATSMVEVKRNYKNHHLAK